MKITAIDVQAKEWRDTKNGNSYFSGTITVNPGTQTEKTILMPFQYGYGDSYIGEATQILIEQGFIPDMYCSLSLYCTEHSIVLRTNKETGCKKSELKN